MDENAFSLCKLSYDQILPYNRDYRVILHKPEKNRQYVGLRDEKKNIVAVCEVNVKKGAIHFDCVFVPAVYRGNHYAYYLVTKILDVYRGKSASAQCNDWSIKTFLKAGFTITSKRKWRYWTAYFVKKEGVKNGKAKT